MSLSNGRLRPRPDQRRDSYHDHDDKIVPPETQPLNLVHPNRLYDGCCQLVTVAHFRNESIVGLFKRHTGERCAGQMNPIHVGMWREDIVEALR